MYRIKFLKNLEQYLAQTTLVLLKHKGGSLCELPLYSDIDLFVMEKEEIVSFFDWCHQQEEVERVQTEKRNDVLHCYLFFKDQGFLQIDLLWELSRKGLIYINQETIKKHTIQNKEIYQADGYLLFTHVVLFNFLNISGVPQHYINHWLGQSAEQLQSWLSSFNQQYGTSFENIATLTQYDERARLKMNRAANLMKDNQFPGFMKRKLSYLWSLVRQYAGMRKGIAITLSGVDGAGKSTVLSKMSSLLSLKYRKKVVCLRHRPSILPILSSITMGKEEAEARAASTLPRKGENKNLLSSLLRFSYYYMDYLLGQVYIYWRYIARGYVVLYDRYYFDFIVDGLRSNIKMPTGVVKTLYAFIYKPVLNVFLYADAATILARKQELGSEDIEILTTTYLDLFNDFQREGTNRYLTIENIQLSHTLSQIEQEYINIQLAS